ncbi:MAG: TrkH family potassium uptake protein [Hydrogenophaga sp.]|nr:TrkH family potassium uptake protein [Hydrogenophaga sp.]
MPLLRVFPVLGVIVMVFSATMLVPLAVAWVAQDGSQSAFPPAMAATFLLGLALRSAVFKVGRKLELQTRDGILLVGLVWTLLPLCASFPLLIHFAQAGTPISFTDAYFEAMSGLTTTGATVITGLDALPGAINLWRCFLQWMGGMGILVLAVAILPMLGVGGNQVFRAEATGPMKEAKLTPRITETAKGLWSVYCGLSLLCVLAYWLGGMSALDAWAHMFTTMSLGGLSTYDASFGHFASPTLEWIAIVFMLVASGNFALYFVAVSKRSPQRIVRDQEWRASQMLLVGASVFVAVLLLVRGVMTDPLEALRTALFNVVSIGSTTGYATTDYTTWPVFAPLFMILLSGIATSAGSTGAGIKMARVLILLKQARCEMARSIHPRMVRPVMLSGHAVDSGTLLSVLGFMLLYGGTIIGLTLVLMLTELPFDTAFSAIVASVNNMGPGLGPVGPAGNFQGLTDLQTWVCTLAMLLGRLEILSFIVLFTPGFWRR